MLHHPLQPPAGGIKNPTVLQTHPTELGAGVKVGQINGPFGPSIGNISGADVQHIDKGEDIINSQIYKL